MPANLRLVTARTGPNIAVVKYWGKRDAGPLNLAVNGSNSLTIDNTEICSQTSSATSPEFTQDRLWLNGEEVDVAGSKRILTVLLQVRQRCPDPEVAKQHIHIVSRNSFPTAAGMASSAAGLAALTLSLSALLGVSETYPGELTTIARMGSGSACRSLQGGMIEWVMGEKADGSDSIAIQRAPENHWPLDMTILVANAEKKHTSSTVGMQRSVATSELMQHRLKNCVNKRLKLTTQAFLERDFETFGRITMQDSNQFHAICMDTFPPVFYLNDVSKQIARLIAAINEASGKIIAAYTFDAGPNAHVFSEPENTDRVRQLLAHFLNFPLDVTEALPAADIEAVGALFGFEPLALGKVQQVYFTKIGGGPLVRNHVSGEGDARVRSLIDQSTGLPLEEDFSLTLPPKVEDAEEAGQ